ncbi:MAG: DUF2127 domain-containing protein [Chloroflexota bacterium]
MSFAADQLTQLLATYGYWAVLVFVMIESTGIPFPGETMLLAASIYAGTTHNVSVGLVIAAAAAGAVIGDNLGFLIGYVGGFRLLVRYGKYVRLDNRKLKLGQYLFLKYGGKVVFFGRFVAVLRAWAAFLAGTNRMPWPRFLLANGAGGLLWATTYGLLGYLLGGQVDSVIGKIGIALAAAVDIGLVIFLRKNMARLEEEAVRALPGPLGVATPRVPAVAPFAPQPPPRAARTAGLLGSLKAAASRMTPKSTLFGRPLGVVLVVVQKAVWGSALTALAGVLLFLRASEDTRVFQGLFAVELKEDPHDLVATFLIGLVPSVSLGAELLLGLGALAYAAIEALQVWGLWRVRCESRPAAGRPEHT